MRTSSIKDVLHFEGNPFGNEQMRHAFLGYKVLKAFSLSYFQTQYILKNKINILSFAVWQILSFVFCPLISDKVSRWVTWVSVCAHSDITMFSAQFWEQKTVLFKWEWDCKAPEVKSVLWVQNEKPCFCCCQPASVGNSFSSLLDTSVQLLEKSCHI